MAVSLLLMIGKGETLRNFFLRNVLAIGRGEGPGGALRTCGATPIVKELMKRKSEKIQDRRVEQNTNSKRFSFPPGKPVPAEGRRQKGSPEGGVLHSVGN